MSSERFMTYLRRQDMILDWIEREHGNARVIWRTNDLGPWDNIRTSWRRCGRQRVLRFRTPQGPMERRISSVRLTREGASILLKGELNRMPEALDLVWSNLGQGAGSQDDLHGICTSFLEQRLQGAQIHGASRRSDLAHSLSNAFLRVHAGCRGRDFFILLAAPGQDEQGSAAMLAQALIWSTLLRTRKGLRTYPTLVLLVPAGRSSVLCHRARLLNPAAASVEVWEYQNLGTAWRFSVAPQPPAPEEHRDYRWPILGPYRWSRELAAVMDLAPNDIRRYPRFEEYDSLRLRGLEFARVEREDRSRVTFGVGPERTELTRANIDDLRRLVQEIMYYRRADSPDVRHPYYRLQAERWLESLILDDVVRLFPELASRSIYSQIPVYLGEAQGRVDILGADSEGTLTVMELKVAEDPELPMQALDYYGRVIQHNLLGDFQKRGYFSEVRLNRRRPRIYLVSPVFSFHDTTERVMSFAADQIEVWKVAVNLDWRCGVKILRRYRIRTGVHD